MAGPLNPARARIALQRVQTAVSSFVATLEEIGPGAGGRGRALAITHAETALLWAEKGIAEGTAPEG